MSHAWVVGEGGGRKDVARFGEIGARGCDTLGFGVRRGRKEVACFGESGGGRVY